MVTYIVRRLVTALLILLGASFLVYLLTAASGDPLADLRASSSPNRAQLIQQRTQLLHLNIPAPLRYFVWLRGAAGCVIPLANACNLGVNLQGQPVTDQLGQAMLATLSLVTAATLLAILIGVSLGIITALRQYSALDYSVTFMAFLFFSLPIFWAAVLLKEFGAIGFNNFLANPVIPISVVLVLSLVFAVIALLIAGKSWKVRGLAFGITFVAAAVILEVLSVSKWFSTPSLGLPLIAIFGVGAAFGVTTLSAGLKNKKALYSALSATAFGLIIYFPIQHLLDAATPLMIFILALVTIGVGMLIGYLWRGYDRKQNMRTAALTAFLMGFLIVVDKLMQTWPIFVNNDSIQGRPIPTIGHATPNFTGDFWGNSWDVLTHLLLPTVALILISIASYTRYARGSMLEIMNMDYIRTARAKGLSERTVVMRHAFRNALIPLATVVAFDLGGLIGGAIITEKVFAFSGMGTMFAAGLTRVDPNPVMGFFIVVAITALVFNLLADLVYSALDPRVKVMS